MGHEQYILIVDDDPDARSILNRAMSSFGVDTRQAADGADAITLIEQQLPSLILLDLMMPHVNGFELLHWLRRQPRTRSIPVIVVSAYVGELDIPELDGLPTLQKAHFRAAQVQQTVSDLLGEPKQAAELPTQLPSMPVPADAGDPGVMRGAISDLLSEREIEVLRLIAQGKSNEDIALELFVTINTVKTHAKNIFDKLHVNSRTQAIAHARDVGLIA